MSSPKLGSYLRTYRLKSGLTQRDVAALLGLKTGSVISRTEKGRGIPSMLVLLGYCVLFAVRPEDLVPGFLHKVEKTIDVRAHVLVNQLRKRQKTSMISERIKFLERLPQLMERHMPKRYEQCKKVGSS